ncbi:hypothetical protein DBR37_11890 [Herminiimonas sp. KBW02]|uniref:hypothetical protein n=1 Tax=Herminiimonas sp. KBW02 TaxID=2153363 RepID=UPI000F5AC58C|nr:hypothetical protein [Herminiimonas sp. KBW02]RQO34295.1 hypothetical protein DBR37_11890 [Herminiimonas sp. KBW02]
MWSTSLAVGVTAADGFNNNLSNSDFLRRYARRLLRHARADEPVKTLPVLRRIIAMQVMPELRVTDLYAVRTSIQLKHVLHMLARELEFSAWEVCKHSIDRLPAAVLDRYRLELGMFGDYRKNWFPDIVTARAWQQQNGGYLVSYGRQVVALLA